MRVTASATSMWAGLRARLHFLATNPSDYVLVRGLFLRGVALVYGLAFLSLWVQVDGLIGAGGVLPAADYLQGLRGQLGSQALALVPTLFWIESSDAMLNAVCAVGVLLAAVAVWLLSTTLATRTALGFTTARALGANLVGFLLWLIVLSSLIDRGDFFAPAVFIWSLGP